MENCYYYGCTSFSSEHRKWITWQFDNGGTDDGNTDHVQELRQQLTNRYSLLVQYTEQMDDCDTNQNGQGKFKIPYSHMCKFVSATFIVVILDYQSFANEGAPDHLKFALQFTVYFFNIFQCHIDQK